MTADETLAIDVVNVSMVSILSHVNAIEDSLETDVKLKSTDDYSQN